MGHETTSAYPTSQCHGCELMRAVTTSTSTFLRCTAPLLPRYPRQPVSSCGAFQAAQGVVLPSPFPGNR